MRILVVNAGSSSLKLTTLAADGEVVHDETVSSARGEVDEAALARAVEQAGAVDAVGHRIVHGGTEFVSPVVVDERVRRRLDALVDLAPLHLPKSLRALDLVSAALPRVPAVACFDTAFHAGIPAAAATYALPAEWRERFTLRRFGFHGLSHAYVARRTTELTGRADARVVSCHLGAGASLAAIAAGASVDTTMGFTPLEGLVMATRSGSVDPGLILWLEQHVGIPPAELAVALEERSGLYGLAGTADLGEVLEREAAGDADAALAVGVYLHRLRAAIAAMAAALGGLDALVFTGGVGENAAGIRARVADGLDFLGIGVDDDLNAASPDAEIGGDRSAVRVFVLRAREDLQVALEVGRVLAPR